MLQALTLGTDAFYPASATLIVDSRKHAGQQIHSYGLTALRGSSWRDLLDLFTCPGRRRRLHRLQHLPLHRFPQSLPR
jgi:hypothetical protein